MASQQTRRDVYRLERLGFAAFGICLAALLFETYRRDRDRKFFLAAPEVSLRGVRTGTIDVQHSRETLVACEDHQGPLPNVPVRLSYHTNFGKATCDPRLHVLLLHGTGMLDSYYWWSRENLRRAGAHAMARAISPQHETRSFVEKVIEAGGKGTCVTTFSMRGHGRSEVTEGPWTTKLLGQDVAAAFKKLHPGERAHVNGLSLGFGAAMQIALEHPEITRSLSGSGFLGDRATADARGGFVATALRLVAWFFSRRPVIDVLGMNLMGFAADVVLSCKPAGLMSALLRYGTTDGFARASASWLGFDASARWPTLQPPLLWLAYPRDHMAGVSLDAARAEFAAVKAAQGPASRSKFVEVSVTGEEAHCRMCEAPDEYVGELMAFVRGVAADSKT